MNTTIVIVCYESKELIQKAYESIRRLYKEIKVIIVDGSSGDCLGYTSSIKSENTSVFQVHHNIGHGNGMHFAMKHVQTKFALLMDSDVEIVSPPIELMESTIGMCYGIGQLMIVNDGGVIAPSGMTYLHPHFALINKDEYFKYDPAAHHGAPLIKPMRQGPPLKEFPVSKYIKHKGRGTVSKIKRHLWTRGWVK